MTISLIFNQTSKLAFDTNFGVLNIDASLEENHSIRSEATENPIQDGSDVTDNIVLKPREVTLKGIISDAPSTLLGSFNNLLDNINGTDSKSRAAYKFFQNLISSKTLFTLVTGLDSYINCCMIDFNILRTAETGRSLTFNATVRSLIIVSADLFGDVGNIAPPNQDQGAGTIDFGKQPGLTVGGEAYENLSNFLGEVVYGGLNQ